MILTNHALQAHPKPNIKLPTNYLRSNRTYDRKKLMLLYYKSNNLKPVLYNEEVFEKLNGGIIV